MNAEDETNITDIELLPDGRVYVFGASAEVLGVLDQIQGGADTQVTVRLDPHGGDCSTRSKSVEAKLGLQYARPVE